MSTVIEGEAEMANLCNTEQDEHWLSDIGKDNPKRREGTFRIDPKDIDNEGFFVGTFVEQGSSAGKKIRGRCSGNTIYFLRPIDKPRFYYEGAYSNDKKKINGTQTSLPHKRGVVQTTEEWEGTKVTR